MSAKKIEIQQINIRIRTTTKQALEQLAEEDRRSMADEADILLIEAIDARRAKAAKQESNPGEKPKKGGGR